MASRTFTNAGALRREIDASPFHLRRAVRDAADTIERLQADLADTGRTRAPRAVPAYLLCVAALMVALIAFAAGWSWAQPDYTCHSYAGGGFTCTR